MGNGKEELVKKKKKKEGERINSPAQKRVCMTMDEVSRSFTGLLD